MKKKSGVIQVIQLSEIAINEVNQRIARFESEKKQKVMQETLRKQTKL